MLRQGCEPGIWRRRAHPSAHRTRHDPGPTAAALAPASGEVRASRCIRPESAEARPQAADPVLASSMLPCVPETSCDRRQGMAKPLFGGCSLRRRFDSDLQAPTCDADRTAAAGRGPSPEAGSHPASLQVPYAGYCDGDLDLLGFGFLAHRQSDRQHAGLVLGADLASVDRRRQRERPRERAITALDAMEVLLRDFRVELPRATQRERVVFNGPRTLPLSCRAAQPFSTSSSLPLL